MLRELLSVYLPVGVHGTDSGWQFATRSQDPTRKAAYNTVRHDKFHWLTSTHHYKDFIFWVNGSCRRESASVDGRSEVVSSFVGACINQGIDS